MKKALTQVIVALAHRGFLTQQDGAVFIEFIVRQCCLPDDAPVSDFLEPRTRLWQTVRPEIVDVSNRVSLLNGTVEYFWIFSSSFKML